MQKQICIVLAGREDRMSILMKYLNTALDKGYLDEVHVWENCRCDSDKLWVESLASEKIKIFKSTKFIEVYTYYKDSDDYFLKLDDDIVYVNIEQITPVFNFLKQQPNNLMFISPVCINNPLHYNLTNIPALLGHGCTAVIDTMSDREHLDQVHRLFTSHFKDVQCTVTQPLLNTPYMPRGLRSPKTDTGSCGHSIGCAWGVEYQGYIPINNIFFTKTLCNYLIKEGVENNDETKLNYPHLEKGYVNFVYPCIFSVHLSYGGQEKDNTHINDYIEMYKNLSLTTLSV